MRFEFGCGAQAVVRSDLIHFLPSDAFDSGPFEAAFTGLSPFGANLFQVQSQIGNSSGGCFGSDRFHALITGSRVCLGQNLGDRISSRQAAFQ